MKLDSKQKFERIRKFIAELKLRPNIQPFLNTEDLDKLVYDFAYINKNPSTFPKLQKKLKDAKYEELNDFLLDLKHIFVSVSDYLFEDDPLQPIVEGFKQEIDKFADKFEEDFRVTLTLARPRPQIELPKKPKEEPKPVRVPAVVEQVAVGRERDRERERGTNITEKLEMLFLLRANENNEAYIRSIGNVYEIGKQLQEEYVITLDNKNTYWMQFLNKQAQ